MEELRNRTYTTTMMRVADQLTHLGLSPLAGDELRDFALSLPSAEQPRALQGMNLLLEAALHSNGHALLEKPQDEELNRLPNPFSRFLYQIAPNGETVQRIMVDTTSVDRLRLVELLSVGYGFSPTQAHRLGCMAVSDSYTDAAELAGVKTRHLTATKVNIIRKIRTVNHTRPNLMNQILDTFLSEIGDRSEYQRCTEEIVIAQELARITPTASQRGLSRQVRLLAHHLSGSIQMTHTPTGQRVIGQVKERMRIVATRAAQALPNRAEEKRLEGLTPQEVQVLRALLGHLRNGVAPKTYEEIIALYAHRGVSVTRQWVQQTVASALKKL